jgi:hypothetical protein
MAVIGDWEDPDLLDVYDDIQDAPIPSGASSAQMMSISTATTSVGPHLGRAFMRAAEDDEVVLHAPGGTETLTVLEVRYERVSVEHVSRTSWVRSLDKGI